VWETDRVIGLVSLKEILSAVGIDPSEAGQHVTPALFLEESRPGCRGVGAHARSAGVSPLFWCGDRQEIGIIVSKIFLQHDSSAR